MEFHPIADRYPLMEGREFEELKDDIREHGLLEPIWIYQGRIIDGRNRWRACQALGVKPPTREWDGKGDLEAFIDSLNLHRRHLSPEKQAALRKQRIERVARGRAKGKSTRQLAAEEGVSEIQIRKDLKKSGEQEHSPDTTQSGAYRYAPDTKQSNGQGCQPETVQGRDGKQYPARKPAETRSEPAAAQPEPEEPEPEEEEESAEEVADRPEKVSEPSHPQPSPKSTRGKASRPPSIFPEGSPERISELADNRFFLQITPAVSELMTALYSARESGAVSLWDEDVRRECRKLLGDLTGSVQSFKEYLKGFHTR